MDKFNHFTDIVKNAFRFYQDLIAEKSVGAYIALGALALVALVVLIFMIIGYQRGGSRETMRLLFAGVALVAAFFATCLIGRAGFFDRSFSSIIPLQKATLAPLLNAPFSVVLLPVVFVVLFVIFNLLLGIPHQLICGILGYTYRRNTALTHWIGAFIGILHGLFIGVIILLPIFAFVRPYAEVAKNPASEGSASVQIYEEYLEDLAESPLYRYTMRFGGEKTLQEIAEGNLGDLISKK